MIVDVSHSKDEALNVDAATCRVASFHLSGARQFSRAHDGGICWLDLEKVEHRYLLSSSADASVALHDTQVGHLWMQPLHPFQLLL